MLSRRTTLSGIAVAAAGAGLSRRARAQAGTIRLGFIAPLSGPAQVIGKELLIGAQVSLDQVNRAGGVGGQKLELVNFDDHGDPAFSVAGLREMAGNGINLIFGLPIAQGAMAGISVLPGLNIVALGTGSAEERLTHELFNRNFFTVSENSFTRQRVLARFMTEHYPEVTNWTAIMPDNAMGHDTWALFSKSLQAFFPQINKREVTISDPVLTKLGATDYKNQLAALMATPSTGLMTIPFGADGITFFQQAKAFGLDRKFRVIAENSLEMDLPKALKRNMPADVWSISYYCFKAYADNPEGQELRRVYERETGDPIPHGLAALSHTAVKAYAAAIHAAGGTETPGIIAALENIKLNTVRGEAHFRRQDHLIIASTCLVNFGPAQADPGWEVKQVFSYDDANNVNPATPGIALKI